MRCRWADSPRPRSPGGGACGLPMGSVCSGSASWKSAAARPAWRSGWRMGTAAGWSSTPGERHGCDRQRRPLPRDGRLEVCGGEPPFAARRRPHGSAAGPPRARRIPDDPPQPRRFGEPSGALRGAEPGSLPDAFSRGRALALTQEPYGSFSHYGRAVHARDLAPVQAWYVVAMHAGKIVARDLGLGQTPEERSFGNSCDDPPRRRHPGALRASEDRPLPRPHQRAGPCGADPGRSGQQRLPVRPSRAGPWDARPAGHRARVPSFLRRRSAVHRGEDFGRGGGAPPRPWQGEAGFSPGWPRLVPVRKRTGLPSVRLG